MQLEQENIRPLPGISGPASELRRSGGVWFLGGGALTHEVLERLLQADQADPAGLFHFSFTQRQSFPSALALVRQIRRNLRAFRLGVFHFHPAEEELDRAYAAGLDLVEIPLASNTATTNESPIAALRYAATVFPRWAVIASLPAASLEEERDWNLLTVLAAEGLLPLLTGGPPAAQETAEAALPFRKLEEIWDRHRVEIRPLLPLLELEVPVLAPSGRRGLGRLLDRAERAGLRAATDLRRLLRVREVEASFESAGL